MISKAFIFFSLLFVAATVTQAAEEPGYAIVVSNPTLQDPAWKRVVDALVAKHQGVVIGYDTLTESQSPLAKRMPRYACFVAKPEEATKEFVAEVHQLTRKLDGDPYTDVIWGILTGYNADNALAIAQTADPLQIRRVAAGTEVPLERCAEGIWYSEIKAGRAVRKKAGENPVAETGPTDTTKILADALNEYKADAFITSGHATEHDWQIGFGYRNGTFRSQGGKLFGVDIQGKKYPIDAPDPKVYLAVGNCLMGHVDGQEAMALAYLNSAGVRQMVGYTELTWFGYGGWGVLDYFLEQPGRFTLAEAFHANHLALLNKLETEFPQDAKKTSGSGTRNGLLYDRDIVAFYGDPAWEARMKPAASGWDQDLTEKDGVFTLTIIPRQDKNSFQPLSNNGSQRGGRPAITFLPHRVTDVVITEGKELAPVITDNFILVPLPKEADPKRIYRVVFSTQRAK